MINEEILNKAKELGEELKKSDTFINMTEQENKVNSNAALMEMSSEYEQLRMKLQEKQLEDKPNQSEIEEIESKLQELKTKIMSHSDMQKLSDYRHEFNQIMEGVNRVIQGVLMPQSGCQGSCASCPGC
ncbi:MAG: YlbF family regulator [Christensenellales bacterium]|jgi:cell fate (sporulation/competence/biofilm development) regulator YlbF (YheA/YmcA/DUF963 family)